MARRCLPRVLVLACAALALALVLLPASAQPGEGKKYALLVGVQEYDHAKQFPALSYAENDVNETAKELKKAGYAVVLLTTRDEKNKPTLANIEKHLDALLAKATKHDLILVGLAGHGMQFDKKEDSYFCPVDARSGDVKTLLSMRSVYKKLEDSPVGVGLLLVDACRDDGRPRGAKRRGVDGDHLPSPPKGVAALFSCSSGQFAWEADKYKHGVFFHFVLEGLRGEAASGGAVTWNSLSNYVSERVSDTVPVLIGGGAKQEPHEMRSLAGKSPVLLSAAKAEVVKDNPGKEEVVKGWPKEITNSIGMKLVRIPKGGFSMGSDADEADRSKDEGPEHEVEITKDFHLGVYEVTQAEYEAVMGSNPSWFSATGKGKAKVEDLKTGRFPVEQVSYEDAVKFCARLSALGKEKEKKRLYRLPSEAEWEYASRGGAGLKKTPFHFGKTLSSVQANFNGNYPYGGAAKGTYLGRTCEVGSYKPNGYGLYDMHGNVWEWCSDWYGEKYYADSPKADPSGPSEGSLRVIRGGCWINDGRDCRSANRYWYSPSNRNCSIGFRVALVPSK